MNQPTHRKSEQMVVRTNDEIMDLAKELAAANKAGTKLPVWDTNYGPADLADAYKLQLATMTAMEPELGKPYGWKIGATNAGAQGALKTDRPFYGRLLQKGRLRGPIDISYSSLNHAVVEVEFAMELKKNLILGKKPFTIDDVKKATSRVILSIEVVSTRFDAFPGAGALNYIGDNGANGAWIEGASSADWIDMDLEAVEIELHKGGKEVAKGSGAVVETGPFGMLMWLANQGVGLKAGEIITTGTMVPPTPATRGDSFTAKFGDLGEIAVRFTA
ncbi:MAG: 2-keto-4-pentenoate hydratase [Alphaproteobacteria bacterium]